MIISHVFHCALYIAVVIYCVNGIRIGYSSAGPITPNNDNNYNECEEKFLPIRVICEVNGFSIPAIIDTGAQISVMSASCAKRCRLAGSIDTRYSGKAIGVGSCEILGRIDNLSMRIGPVTFNSQISVLKDSSADFLIGLDFLRRFQGEISMRENVIRLRVRDKNVRVNFLNDKFDGGISSINSDQAMGDCSDVSDSDNSMSEDARYNLSYRSRLHGNREATATPANSRKTRESVRIVDSHFSNDSDSDDFYFRDGISMEGV